MKIKEAILAVSILLLGLNACNQNSSGRNNPLAEKQNVTRQPQNEGTEVAKVSFTEGRSI